MPSVSSLLRRIKRTLYVYGDESGDLRRQPYFLLGVLLMRDPQRHDRQVHTLRQQHRYYPELKYGRTDRHKAAFAKAVIEYFWREPDLRFVTKVIDTSQHDLSHFEKFDSGIRPQDVAYNYWYKRLILSSTPQQDELVIILDSRTRARKDNLPQYLERAIPNLKSLQLVNSRKHQMVQVADLLTGSVYGDITGVRQPVKRDIIDALKNRLGVASLWDRSLASNDKFCVDVWRPPRTGA